MSGLAGGAWLNPPPDWSLEGGELRAVTGPKTDFWRATRYGFIRDNGHFYGCPTEPRFTATLRVRADYRELYDQAGIMVRVDAETWVKAGIEHTDGQAMLSSVLTAGRSDWAVAPWWGEPADLRLRASVADGVLRLQAAAATGGWTTIRLAPFPAVAAYQVGPMCCTPQREGLAVRFSDFSLTAEASTDPHDLD